MSKIYYNVKQFKNALATGLLGLATLGPMTSCEKEEHGNSNQYENFYDNGETDSEDEKNNQGEESDNGEVSKENFVFGDYEGVTGNTYGYYYKNDGTYRTDQKVVNENGTFLCCNITVDGVTYLIVFKKQDNGELKLYKYNNKVIDIFNKYRIEDKYYTDRGFNPPVLPLKIDNL